MELLLATHGELGLQFLLFLFMAQYTHAVMLDGTNTVIGQFLKTEKPAMTHVVLTGRNAADELLEMADLATEMTLLSHPFRSGIKAQQGVEF